MLHQLCPSRCNQVDEAIAVGGCAICSPGTYGVDGDTVCTDCPVDTFASSSGQTACTACPQGEYFNGTGASACTACDLPTSDGNLTNGGFEDDGTLGTYVRQVPSGWSGVGSVFIIPSGDAVWSSITAPSGATFVGIEYTAGTASSINQTLNLTNGVQYELSFYARYRTQAGVTFLVSVQGAVVFGPTTLTGTFTQYRSTFTVPHGVCGMDFSSLVDIKISTVGDTGDRSTLLDDVQLTAIQNFCDCPCPAGYTGIGISGPSTGRCTACDAGKYKSINGYVSRDLGQAILALHVTCICPALCVRTGPLAVNNITYCLPVCASSTEHPAPLSVILGMSTDCESCPVNSTSHIAANELADCICKKGFEGPDGAACSACAVGYYKPINGSTPCILPRFTVATIEQSSPIWTVENTMTVSL
eukprot:347701-Rhodomonas_salina.2